MSENQKQTFFVLLATDKLDVPKVLNLGKTEWEYIKNEAGDGLNSELSLKYKDWKAHHILLL